MPPASNVLMVRPAVFAFNAETAATNAFQKRRLQDPVYSLGRACYEFDRFITLLQAHHVNTWVVQDTPTPITPDALFVNNWISTHSDGTVFLYPMAAANRQAERNPAVLSLLKKHFRVRRTVDLSHYEAQGKPLESTGSMVFDRTNDRFFACLSPRTHPDTVMAFAQQSGFHPIIFNACDRQGRPYYHTNMMMSVGDRFVLICLESITHREERRKVVQAIEQTNREIVVLSYEQIEQYCAGNALQIQNKRGESLLVLSAQAHRCLNAGQRTTLEKHTRLLPVAIPFIEQVGGGSVRCMMSEIVLPRRRSTHRSTG